MKMHEKRTAQFTCGSKSILNIIKYNISSFLLEKFEHEPMEFVNGFINQNRSQKTDKQIALKQDSFTLVTSN